MKALECNPCPCLPKRAHCNTTYNIIAQNAKIWHLPSYHHFKAVRVSDLILGLWAHQAFCFTIPTFEAIDILLSEVGIVKPEV